MRRDKTLLIDGDSMCFLCSKDSFEESVDLIDKLFAEMVKRTGANRYILFLSKGPYYRHDVNPLYKATRPPIKLKWIKSLRSYLVEKYHAHTPPGIEADDAVAYYRSFIPNSVICAIDKDVLKQVEGEHYNYRERKFWITTPEDAHKWIYMQTLMGDSTDNIKGLPGIGPKKAEKMLESYAPDKYKHVALEAYCKQYGEIIGVSEFYKNFYQVYLLRTKEEIELFVPDLPIVEPVEIVNDEKEEW